MGKAFQIFQDMIYSLVVAYITFEITDHMTGGRVSEGLKTDLLKYKTHYLAEKEIERQYCHVLFQAWEVVDNGN